VRTGVTTLPLTGERTVPGLPAENYWFRRHVAAYRFARRLVRGRVIDAGSGEGYGAALLARRARTVGLELDPAVVAHAGRRYHVVPFVRADLCHPPLADGTTDAIVAVQVLEHLHCADGFVEASRRALVPGGALIVSTPNAGTFPPGNPSHVHEYSAEELDGLLREHFDHVRLAGLHHAPQLALLERLLGEPLQHRLVREGYESQRPWLRAVLRTVTSQDFRLSAKVDDCIDLFAVAAVR
jgi:SAM-dependent methyltransferase